MGSAGHGEFPEGTNIQFLEAGKNAGSSPQADLMERADKNCDLLILGQTLTSDTGNSGAGGGSLALGKVHQGVRDQIIQSAANFAARVLNQQLIPAILLENYGDAEEAPYFCPEPETQKDLTATATMIKTAVETGFKVPAKWAHSELNIPLPQAGEEIIERAAPTPGTTVVPPASSETGSGMNGNGMGTEAESKTEDAAELEASRAAIAPNLSDAERNFIASVAEKRDAALALLARIVDIKDDSAMIAALKQFYAEMPALTAIITADVTRQQRALEQITAPALADGLQGKKP
jgi:phage gp29-like protein